MKHGIDLGSDRILTLRTGLDEAPLAYAEDGVEIDRATLHRNGVFGFDQLDARARAFILLRAQLFNHFHRAGGRVLAVTSTQPGNGKTYVAANLAAALSRIHPTILVDLDLRRPSVGERLGLADDEQAGIDDYLAGRVAFAATATRVHSCALKIHRARTPRHNSAELLASPQLARMFETIRAMPDAPICIVDTPPVLLLDDIVLIARAVDGILMVVEEGKTRRSDLSEAIRFLSPTPIVGSVLNKSLSSTGSQRGYDYYGRERKA